MMAKGLCIVFLMAMASVFVNGQGIIPGIQNICFEPAESGVCRAFIPSFYFNPLSGSCDCFIYGGCRGNHNRFGTLADCMSVCSVRPELQFNTPSCDRIFGNNNPLTSFVYSPHQPATSAPRQGPSEPQTQTQPIEIELPIPSPSPKPQQNETQTEQPATQPEQTSESQPEKPTTQPEESAPQPQEPAAQTEKPVTQPKESAAQPEKPVTQPKESAAQPEKPVTQPKESAAQPEKPVTQPKELAAQPENSVTQPEVSASQPAEPATQPEESEGESSDSGNNPLGSRTIASLVIGTTGVRPGTLTIGQPVFISFNKPNQENNEEEREE